MITFKPLRLSFFLISTGDFNASHPTRSDRSANVRQRILLLSTNQPGLMIPKNCMLNFHPNRLIKILSYTSSLHHLYIPLGNITIENSKSNVTQKLSERWKLNVNYIKNEININRVEYLSVNVRYNFANKLAYYTFYA